VHVVTVAASILPADARRCRPCERRVRDREEVRRSRGADLGQALTSLGWVASGVTAMSM
jgi:hypothetical protein